MGFLTSTAYPPPLLVQNPDACDRFGLPLNPSFLGETAQEFGERMAMTERLVFDAIDTVIRQIGTRHARQLFEDAFKEKPSGKKPNQRRNAKLMEAFRSEIASGTSKRRAPLDAARKCVKDWEDPQPLARQIRKLVKAEERDAESYARWRAKMGSSFLGDPENTF
jgi:hypothetical protein